MMHEIVMRIRREREQEPDENELVHAAKAHTAQAIKKLHPYPTSWIDSVNPYRRFTW